ASPPALPSFPTRRSSDLRIAAQEHPQVKLKSDDTVILSATPIPGNEELVSRTINNCYKHGARVFYSARNRVHASGHASRVEDTRSEEHTSELQSRENLVC